MMNIILGTLLIVTAMAANPLPPTNPSPYKQLDSLMESYDRRVRPGANRPLSVAVSGHVVQLNKVDLRRQEVEVVINLRLIWKEERMAAMSKTVKLKNISSFWHPDLLFVNEIKMPISHQENIVSISRGGEVSWSQRVTKKVSCAELGNGTDAYYQVTEEGWAPCTLRLESYGFTVQDIVFTIKKGKEGMYGKDGMYGKYGMEGMEGMSQSFQADTKRVFLTERGQAKSIKKIIPKVLKTVLVTGTYSTIDVTLMIGDPDEEY